VGAINKRGGLITLAAGDGTKYGKPRVVAVRSLSGWEVIWELRQAAKLTQTVVSFDLASYWLALLSASCGVSGARWVMPTVARTICGRSGQTRRLTD
jgi:hypothetical protein